MKQLILAAVAATLVFASAAQAAAPAKADQAPVTMMSAEDCAKAMAACADQACKDALMKDHGCKAE